jgi:PKD repeat protein
MASITSLPSGVTGSSLVLLSTRTASSSSTIDFTSDIDSTYKEYQFHFIDIHPSGDGTKFQFQVDTGTNTNYNQTITSTSFYAYHAEDDSGTSLTYDGSYDQAQGTGFQDLIFYQGNGNDESCVGILQLFDPSNTTFVKHFISRGVRYSANDQASDEYAAGYVNTTTALTRVRFKFNSGTIDAGTIKMYGVV